MSFWSGVKSIFTGEFVKDIGDAIDKNVTSDEERLILRNELSKISSNAEIKLSELEAQQETERTTRHTNDMKSDSWMSKNIRPLSLIYLLTIVTVLAFADSFSVDVTVDEKWVSLFQVLLVMVFTFYFTSRGIEKITKMIGSNFGKNK